jgi:hypothetical protein
MPNSVDLYLKPKVVTDIVGNCNWRAPISVAELSGNLDRLGKRKFFFWKRPPLVHQIRVAEGAGSEIIGYQLELEGGGQLNLIKIEIPQPEMLVEVGYGPFARKTKRVEMDKKYGVWIGVPSNDGEVKEGPDWGLQWHGSMAAAWADIQSRTKKYRPVISAK